MSTTRGILYIKWGEKMDPILARSIESAKIYHPELPIHVQDYPPDSNLLIKSGMFDVSPFDETLFLDVDTILFDRLDYAFEKARQFGLACCTCENPWARRHRGLADAGDMVEYNTGVLFFARAAKPVFDRWRDLSAHIDSATEFIKDDKPKVQPFDDQAAFAKAVGETGFNPFVLPLNWNFRPPFHKLFFGPIKIYHDFLPAPAALVGWNEQQGRAGEIIRSASLSPTP